jgi:hypothetical protein
MKKRLLHLAFLLLTCLGLLSTPIIFGENALGRENAPANEFELAVSPPVAYLKLKPGTRGRHTITLTNHGSTELKIAPRVVDFLPDGTSGRPVIQDSLTFPYLEQAGIESDKLQNRVSEGRLEPISLPAGKKAQLTLVFNIPQEAPDREYPLTILFESDQSVVTNPLNQSYVKGSLGSNLIVLISKHDQPPYGLEVETLSVPPVIDTFSRIKLAPLVRNRGFSASVATGTATIKNWQGKTVAEYKIFPDVVLGNSSRVLRAAVEPSDPISEEGLIPGEFIFKPPFLLGPYTIDLTLQQVAEEELTGNSVRYSQTVFALPLFVIVIALVGIGVSTIYWVKIRKKSAFLD